MTAIWPAGPPKLKAATLAHTHTASRDETPCAGTSSSATLAISTLVISFSHRIFRHQSFAGCCFLQNTFQGQLRAFTAQLDFLSGQPPLVAAAIILSAIDARSEE